MKLNEAFEFLSDRDHIRMVRTVLKVRNDLGIANDVEVLNDPSDELLRAMAKELKCNVTWTASLMRKTYDAVYDADDHDEDYEPGEETESEGEESEDESEEDDDGDESEGDDEDESEDEDEEDDDEDEETEYQIELVDSEDFAEIKRNQTMIQMLCWGNFFIGLSLVALIPIMGGICKSSS
jgi:nitric oxide reductase activation protein